MRRGSSRRPTLLDQVLPPAFLALSVFETFFEVTQIGAGWARSLVRVILVVTLVAYYEFRTRGVQTLFRQLFLYGFLATLMAEILSIFAESDRGVFILYLIVNAAAYFLFAYAFTLNIMEGKVSTGLPITLGVSLPFVVLGIIVYVWLKNHLDEMKIFVIIYMFLLYGMGIQSAVRNFNTNKKSFMPALIGGAGLVVSESLLLITHFIGGKWPVVFALIVLIENFARFGLLKGALEHIEYFVVAGKDIVGESLFGGKIKTRPKEM